MVDLKNPIKEHKFSIDALNFPMTVKYNKKKLIDVNYDKPPLPPVNLPRIKKS